LPALINAPIVIPPTLAFSKVLAVS
jgi:hypothetical protein